MKKDNLARKLYLPHEFTMEPIEKTKYYPDT